MPRRACRGTSEGVCPFQFRQFWTPDPKITQRSPQYPTPICLHQLGVLTKTQHTRHFEEQDLHNWMRECTKEAFGGGSGGQWVAFRS